MALELSSAEATAADEDAADIPDPGDSAVLDVAVAAPPPDEDDPRCRTDIDGGGDEPARCKGIDPTTNVPAAISAHCTSNPIRAILAGCFL